jgi:thymidylate synthase (FAD)
MTAVRLVSVSQPVNDPYLRGPEDLLAFCARVSNPENQMNTETGPKLIKYLIKNKHWSPLEMVSATMEVTTTRDIARQLLRHRSFSFQEFSQRYSEASEFDFREARKQDTKNRQNSIDLTDSQEDQDLDQEWFSAQMDIMEFIKTKYRWALDHGIAKEQARAILPEGMTVSRLYVSGTLRSWIHYCQLRMANGTQREHQELAVMCWEALGKQFPNTVEACNGLEF